MQTYFFIRTDNKCVKIKFHEIVYIEANRNYVKIVSETKAYLVLLSLKQLERILPENSFCRVHRSYIVSLDHVTCFDPDMINIAYGNKKESLPIGTQYRKLLHQKIMVVASQVRHSVRYSSIGIETLIGDDGKN